MVVPLTLVSSFGLITVYETVRNVFLRYKAIGVLFSVFVVFVSIGSLIYFFDSYFIHLPIHNAKYWNYGYKEVIEKILPIQNNYKVIYFQQSYDQPYIYYLFYSKYDPAKYQKQANLSYYLGPDVGLVEKVG